MWIKRQSRRWLEKTPGDNTCIAGARNAGEYIQTLRLHYTRSFTTLASPVSYLVLVLLFNVEGSTTSSDPVHDNPFDWKASKSWPASQHSASSPVLQAQPPALTLPKAVVIHMKPSVLLGWMCTPSFSSQNCKKPYRVHKREPHPKNTQRCRRIIF